MSQAVRGRDQRPACSARCPASRSLLPGVQRPEPSSMAQHGSEGPSLDQGSDCGARKGPREPDPQVVPALRIRSSCQPDKFEGCSSCKIFRAQHDRGASEGPAPAPSATSSASMPMPTGVMLGCSAVRYTSTAQSGQGRRTPYATAGPKLLAGLMLQHSSSSVSCHGCRGSLRVAHQQQTQAAAELRALCTPAAAVLRCRAAGACASAGHWARRQQPGKGLRAQTRGWQHCGTPGLPISHRGCRQWQLVRAQACCMHPATSGQCRGAAAGAGTCSRPGGWRPGGRPRR